MKKISPLILALVIFLTACAPAAPTATVPLPPTHVGSAPVVFETATARLPAPTATFEYFPLFPHFDPSLNYVGFADGVVYLGVNDYIFHPSREEDKAIKFDLIASYRSGVWEYFDSEGKKFDVATSNLAVINANYQEIVADATSLLAEGTESGVTLCFQEAEPLSLAKLCAGFTPTP